MHEFPEVQAMIRQVQAQAPAGVRITRLRIVVGEASGHDPNHIQQHFLEASRGTLAEGAELQFIPEPLTARCAACDAEYKTGELALYCNHCGGTKLTICTGEKVYLAGFEVELLPYTPQRPESEEKMPVSHVRIRT